MFVCLSVCLSVCLFVCLSVNFFFVKDFSATTWVRTLKFGTRLDSDELYCVTKEQPHIAYQSLYLFIFLSLQWKKNFVKDFSATTWVRILKFGTKLDSDELYCVTKEQPHIAYQSLYLLIFICSFFFLSNGNFCHRFLSPYWSQCFQILFTSLGWQSVLCKRKLRC